MQDYRKILCATDFSPASEQAVQRAARLARSAGAHLTLLHVVQRFPVDRSNELVVPEDIDPADYRREQARGELNRLLERLDYNDLDAEIIFSERPARKATTHYANEQGNDLIVIAADGHHGITPVLGSSTPDAVAHGAGCDVLMVRVGEAGKA